MTDGEEKVDWNSFVIELQRSAPGAHRLNSGCPAGRIREAESVLGPMPVDLSAMLVRFNGAELFIAAIPFVTVFGLPGPEDSPAQGWFVDRYTRTWRERRRCGGEWVVGITSYGGLAVLKPGGVIAEWDSSLGRWSSQKWGFADWAAWVLAEGKVCLESG